MDHGLDLSQHLLRQTGRIPGRLAATGAFLVGAAPDFGRRTSTAGAWIPVCRIPAGPPPGLAGASTAGMVAGQPLGLRRAAAGELPAWSLFDAHNPPAHRVRRLGDRPAPAPSSSSARIVASSPSFKTRASFGVRSSSFLMDALVLA